MMGEAQKIEVDPLVLMEKLIRNGNVFFKSVKAGAGTRVDWHDPEGLIEIRAVFRTPYSHWREGEAPLHGETSRTIVANGHNLQAALQNLLINVWSTE